VVADYRSIALNEKLRDSYKFPTYPCVTPSWDNDARKKGKGFVYQNSSPDLYAEWLRGLIEQETSKKKAPLVFVNAWNEWAEGAIMEPSMHLGHAVLNRTAEVLAQASHNIKNLKSFPAYGITRNVDKKLAVVVHLYYTDLWPTIQARLKLIKEPFDLFVTLNERDKDFKLSIPGRKDVKTTSFVLPNRGRDVLPFLFVAQRLRMAGYEYVLKLHSKKSKHRVDGFNWFTDVLDALLPDGDAVAKVLEVLKSDEAGIIGPQNHLVSLKRHMGGNEYILQSLLDRAFTSEIARKVVDNPAAYPYFGGTMFWARLDTFTPILDLYLMPDDFQSEHGQIDGTTAHALERMFGVVCRLQEKNLYLVSATGLEQVPLGLFDEKYQYAP